MSRRNVGRFDRAARLLGAAGLLVCAAVAPVSLPLRLIVFGASGVYMALSALAGRCVGYSLLGLSTCPLERGGQAGAPR